MTEPIYEECENCGRQIALREDGWRHVDEVGCLQPEPTASGHLRAVNRLLGDM